MTWRELEKIEGILKNNGYRRCNGCTVTTGDYYWYKGFNKGKHEEGRSAYNIMFCVFDWRKYWDRDASLKKLNKAAGLMVEVSVSRTINECPKRLLIDVKKDEFDLIRIERQCAHFYEYVNRWFEIPEE